MFVQENPLVVKILVQQITLALATFIQVKPLMRVMFFQVHLFVVMFLQGDIFVEEMFVKVNQLMIQIFIIEILLTRGMLLQVNLLILTISISLIHH